MATAVNDLVDRAETLLHDEGNDRWDAADLIIFGSHGEVAIITRKPDAYVKNEAFVLVEGTLQTVDGTVLIDIVRNMGTDGSTEGAAITKVDKVVMDAADPDWHTATASATVKHWMADLRDPKRFWVYPPQPSSSFGYVQGVWAATPSELSAGGNINLDDIYKDALLDYILFRAFSIDASLHPNAAARALKHGQLFLDAIGSKESIEQLYDTENAKG